MAFLEALQPAAAAPAPQPTRVQPARGQAVSTRPAPRPDRPTSAAGEQGEPSSSSAPAAEESASSTELSPGPSQQLEQNWKRIIDLTRQHSPTTYGLLNSAKARQLKDGVLTLGYEGDVLRHKMDTAVNIDVLRSVLQEVFGEDIQVRVVTITGKRTTPPPGVDSDGMVASALRDLGGEIVDIH